MGIYQKKWKALSCWEKFWGDMNKMTVHIFFYCTAVKEIRESTNDFSTYLIYNSLLGVGQLLIQGLGPNKKAAKDIFCFLHNMIPDGEASHYIEL
jgi:hypothetical protein